MDVTNGQYTREQHNEFIEKESSKEHTIGMDQATEPQAYTKTEPDPNAKQPTKEEQEELQKKMKQIIENMTASMPRPKINFMVVSLRDQGQFALEVKRLINDNLVTSIQYQVTATSDGPLYTAFILHQEENASKTTA